MVQSHAGMLSPPPHRALAHSADRQFSYPRDRRANHGNQPGRHGGLKSSEGLVGTSRSCKPDSVCPQLWLGQIPHYRTLTRPFTRWRLCTADSRLRLFCGLSADQPKINTTKQKRPARC
jgi:hypothetical protein